MPKMSKVRYAQRRRLRRVKCLKLKIKREQQALSSWWHGQTLFVRETKRGL